MQIHLFFKKKLISQNSTFYYINTVQYDINSQSEHIASVVIKSFVTAEITVNNEIFHIKPIVKFWTVSRLNILTAQNQKIGQIHFWGWTWKKPTITLYKEGNNEVWKFQQYRPRLFQRTNSSYTTGLTNEDKSILYRFVTGNYFTANTRNECLKELSGTIDFSGPFSPVSILGVYLNELLIFDQMDK